MKKQRLTSFLILCSIFNFFSTSSPQEAEWKGTIENEDGVKVIVNPEEPMYDQVVLNLEEDLCVGKAYGDEKYSFIRLWYLAVDDEENIYAMDQGETMEDISMISLILKGNI